MVLKKQLVSIPFTKGIDTFTDEFIVDPFSLLEVNNAYFTKSGAITKRYGYSKIENKVVGSTSTVQNAQKLTNYNNDLILLSNTNVYSYVAPKTSWINKGTYSTINVESSPISKESRTQQHFDYAENQGFYAAVWYTTEGVKYSIYESDTNSTIISNMVLHATTGSVTALNPKIAVCLNSFVIFYWTQESGKDYLRCKVVDIEDISTLITPSTYLYSNASAGTDSILPYAVATYDGFVFVVNNKIATTQMQMAYILPDGEIATTPLAPSPTNTITGDYCNSSLAIVRVNQTWVITGRNSVNVDKVLILKWILSSSPAHYKVFDDPYDTDLGTKLISIVSTSETSFIVASSNTPTNPLTDAKIMVHAVTTGNLSANDLSTLSITAVQTGVKSGVVLASKLFMNNGTTYMLASYQGATADIDNLQPTHFIFDSNLSLVGKLLPGTAGNHVSNLPSVFNSTTVIGSRISVQAQEQFMIPIGITRVKLNFDDPVLSSAQLGDNLHITGGFLYGYDGQTIVEQGFHLFPEEPVATPVASGALDETKTYEYFAVYEWVDARGQVHQSAPSAPLTVYDTTSSNTPKLSATNKTVTIVVYKLPVTSKPGVDIVLYRTEGNGTIPYRLDSISNTYGANAYVTFTDAGAVTDTVLASRQFLYTVGGIIENIAPPACTIVQRHINRLFIAGLEEGNTVWYSKAAVEGVGVEFSDIFRFRCNPAGGPISALASLDDKLIIFKEDSIYALAGQGPTDNGASNDFLTPQLIVENTGCKTQNSIVSIPEGIMFKSDKGIWLLDRALSLTYIGSPAEKFNSLSVTSAVSIPDLNQVRFTTSDGEALIYNTFLKLWSTFTDYQALSATTWFNTYYFINTNGVAQKETAGNYQDNYKFYSMKVTTSWIKSDIQGRMRIYTTGILGRFTGDPIVRISMYADYNELQQEVRHFKTGGNIDMLPWADTITYWGDSVIMGSALERTYQFITDWDTQRLTSSKYTFEDIESPDTNSSFELTTLTLQMGIKQGIMNKARDAQ